MPGLEIFVEDILGFAAQLSWEVKRSSLALYLKHIPIYDWYDAVPTNYSRGKKQFINNWSRWHSFAMFSWIWATCLWQVFQPSFLFGSCWISCNAHPHGSQRWWTVRLDQGRGWVEWCTSLHIFLWILSRSDVWSCCMFLSSATSTSDGSFGNWINT
jgi:hypothetical protein